MDCRDDFGDDFFPIELGPSCTKTQTLPTLRLPIRSGHKFHCDSSSLVDVGRRVEAALGAAPGQQHELALAHAQEEARAGAAPVRVAGARAHSAGAVVDRSLQGVHRQSRFLS